MTRLFKRLIVALLAVSLALIGPAACADDAANIIKLIKRVYKVSILDFACYTPEDWPDTRSKTEFSKKREHYFRPIFEEFYSPDLLGAYMKECAIGSTGIDARYAEDANYLLDDGFKLTYFKIHPPRIHGSKAGVSVRFINDPKNIEDKDQREAFYKLIKTEKGWRVMDIEWSYGRATWKPYQSIENNQEIHPRESLMEYLKNY